MKRIRWEDREIRENTCDGEPLVKRVMREDRDTREDL